MTIPCQACGEEARKQLGMKPPNAYVPTSAGTKPVRLCEACEEAHEAMVAEEVESYMWRIRLRRGLEKGVME